MMSLDNHQAALNEFIRIIEQQPALQPLARSQVMQGLNIFQNLALSYALHRVERAHQESYLSTALNRSSILALAEDRQYLPTRPAPSQGTATIINNSAETVGLPAGLALLSEQQLHYQLVEGIKIPANSRATVAITQLKQQQLTFTIEEEKPFIELLLETALSTTIHQLQVWVDEGEGPQEWQQARLFRNTDGDSLAYDEFYTHTDQVGIRLGNGIFGKIPARNATVTIALQLTEGQTTLMPSQPLFPLQSGIASDIEITTANVIEGGRPGESIEAIRRNALYYPLYNENKVWDDDYVFFIKRNHPSVLWCNVWGEQEAETMHGTPNVDFINKIFICVYAPDDEAIGDKILASLQAVPQLNRRYELVKRNDVGFAVNIKGTLHRSVVLSEARQKIQQLLIQHYDKHSPLKREKAQVRDFYRLMNNLGIFDQHADIAISIDGPAEPKNLSEMLFIDIEKTMAQLTLTY
ncbi:lipopolysaccharide biosynthesis protein BplA [Endozoicomonas sp. SM1973]|uniref:Lipopolysaccharide biosynthesis protein BplA n=2 Tax=Spartinivicinus marinus TaxID=2994442 RepID=A0A853INJ5_9GAMM|nr:lipopolysaccharide biosynthesis protein BplA [Spartinivicinus marinus]MCX4030460.1 hypothetical protein [Spartinivicinus marinus]NYZ69416.1 lipopolysaccharide biosynthesis protein BplA [Spartinivicinus marinus]